MYGIKIDKISRLQIVACVNWIDLTGSNYREAYRFFYNQVECSYIKKEAVKSSILMELFFAKLRIRGMT